MEAKVGVVRDAAGLAEAVSALESRADQCDAALVALMIARGALARQESRGAHWRSDFPHTAPAAHTETTLAALKAAPRDHRSRDGADAMTQSVLTQSVLTEEILPLPRLLVEPVVRAALVEDLGRAGDITTDAIVPPGERMRGVIASRQAGVISGTDAASIAFALIDPAVTVTVERGDGARVSPGDVVLRLEGPARAILTAERVALNLLCRMSGVATATNGLVEAARPHGKASIVCTRKTTPGLRALEKHAVRAGGGSNHRFGLDDAVLIKDNHVAVAGGIVPAIERARARAGHLVKIECEVDSLDQLEEALSIGSTRSCWTILVPTC